MTKKIDLTKYELDRDLPDNFWNEYMKKYSSKYRVFKDDDGIWYIKCKKGKIAMWSIIKHKAFFISNPLTSKQKTYFLKKTLENSKNQLDLVQDSIYEFVITFDENLISSYAYLLGIVKRMKLSKEEKERRRNQMIGLREKLGK